MIEDFAPAPIAVNRVREGLIEIGRDEETRSNQDTGRVYHSHSAPVFFPPLHPTPPSRPAVVRRAVPLEMRVGVGRDDGRDVIDPVIAARGEDERARWRHFKPVGLDLPGVGSREIEPDGVDVRGIENGHRGPLVAEDDICRRI